MASRIWNEKGRVWEDDYGLLDEAQMRGASVQTKLSSSRPRPPRMMSNGEYMPALQTEKQARVCRRRTWP